MYCGRPNDCESDQRITWQFDSMHHSVIVWYYVVTHQYATVTAAMMTWFHTMLASIMMCAAYCNNRTVSIPSLPCTLLIQPPQCKKWPKMLVCVLCCGEGRRIRSSFVHVLVLLCLVALSFIIDLVCSCVVLEILNVEYTQQKPSKG